MRDDIQAKAEQFASHLVDHNGKIEDKSLTEFIKEPSDDDPDLQAAQDEAIYLTAMHYMDNPMFIAKALGVSQARVSQALKRRVNALQQTPGGAAELLRQDVVRDQSRFDTRLEMIDLYKRITLKALNRLLDTIDEIPPNQLPKTAGIATDKMLLLQQQSIRKLTGTDARFASEEELKAQEKELDKALEQTGKLKVVEGGK